MIRGVDLSRLRDFACKNDPDDPKTIWRIAPLSALILRWITSQVLDNSFALGYEAVRFGLIGLEHFCDADGHLVHFCTESQLIHNGETVQVVSAAIMRILPTQIVNEVGAEILRMSGSVKATS